MRPLILCALLLGLANPAHALSCLRPDPVQDFLEADASDDVWIVVDGVLKFDEAALPPRDVLNNDAPPATDIAARLAGKSLSPKGFQRVFDQKITLRIQCFGPWCGGTSDGARYLAFLKREGQGYVLMANPCGARVYPDPKPALRKTLTACMRGEACTPAPRRR